MQGRQYFSELRHCLMNTPLPIRFPAQISFRRRVVAALTAKHDNRNARTLYGVCDPAGRQWFLKGFHLYRNVCHTSGAAILVYRCVTCSHPPASASGCNWLSSSVRSATLSICDSEIPHAFAASFSPRSRRVAMPRERRWRAATSKATSATVAFIHSPLSWHWLSRARLSVGLALGAARSGAPTWFFKAVVGCPKRGISHPSWRPAANYRARQAPGFDGSSSGTYHYGAKRAHAEKSRVVERMYECGKYKCGFIGVLQPGSQRHGIDQEWPKTCRHLLPTAADLMSQRANYRQQDDPEPPLPRNHQRQ